MWHKHLTLKPLIKLKVAQKHHVIIKIFAFLFILATSWLLCDCFLFKQLVSLSLDFLVMEFEFLWAELLPLSAEPWMLSLLKCCKLLLCLQYIHL